jgi:hypothetical protein
MNFLWILQVLALIFILNINFLIHLFNLIGLWTGRQNPRTAGVILQKILRLSSMPQWTAGWFAKKWGARLQNSLTERIHDFRSHWIWSERYRLDSLLSNWYVLTGGRIKGQRPRFNESETTHTPPIQILWSRFTTMNRYSASNVGHRYRIQRPTRILTESI